MIPRLASPGVRSAAAALALRWLGALVVVGAVSALAGCLRIPDQIREELRPGAAGHYGPPPDAGRG